MPFENLKKVREQLLELKGVGNKVADWIALFSMNCHDSIPVDTHVKQIASRVYLKHKSEKSIKYDDIMNAFYDAFGEYWGWAHSVLFASELPKYREIIDREIEMTKPKKKKSVEIIDETMSKTKRKSKILS